MKIFEPSSAPNMTTKMALLGLFVVVLISCWSSATAQLTLDPELVVETNNGRVWGEVWDLGRSFRGVPFAAPPVGREGRWKPPKPARSWGTDPLMTRDFAAGCAQNCEDGVTTPPHTCPQKISEDCLYLNVYTPRRVNNTASLPVMVFIHGGNFVSGMPNTLYEGLAIANRSLVVVVTIAYRLGALGFLVAPGLNNGEVTNLGIQDQRLALQWVQQNIRNFGGNPNSVTLLGQSAGGRSVTVHLVSRLSQGLFHRAIIQSDPLTIVCSDKDDALAFADRFGDAIGCSASDADCLYLKTIDEIVAAQEAASRFIPIDEPISAFMLLLPSVDGVDIVDQPYRLLLNGDFAKIPIMMGTVSEETVLYINLGWPEPVSLATYRALLTVVFRSNASRVLEMYPPLPDGQDQRPVMWELGTDYVFTCPNRFAARAIATQVPTFNYIFDYVWSFDGWGPNFDYCVGYVCHAADLPILFGTAPLFFTLSKEEYALSYSMMDYFGTFAANGDPNTSTQPLQWPRYSAASDEHLHFQTPANQVLSGYRKTNCDLFDELSYDPIRKQFMSVFFNGARFV